MRSLFDGLCLAYLIEEVLRFSVVLLGTATVTKSSLVA